MRKIALILVFICICFSISACKVVNAGEDGASSISKGRFDEPLKGICNSVMIAIYNDILSIRGDHDNLVDFGEHVLSRNQHGVYTIEYQRKISDGARKGEFLNFGVTIVKPADANFNEFGRQAFNFGFPLLDIKIAGYQQTNRKWMKFSIQDVVQRNGDLLLEEQKKYLPLKVSLKTDKESYKVGENIPITATLENVSRKNLWIRALDRETLYFLYDNAQWGAVELGKRTEERREKFILKPGEKVHKRFIGSGSSVPREIEIYCSYAITFKGVKPSSVIKVKIIE